VGGRCEQDPGVPPLDVPPTGVGGHHTASHSILIEYEKALRSPAVSLPICWIRTNRKK
jgi:hypothetical protein